MPDGFYPIWKDMPVPIPDAGGDLATQRGSDPNAQQAGANGLQPIWTDDPVSDPSGAETPNSVSSLPARPARFAPSGTPPAPPSLQDRNPGTIDEQ